MITRLQYVSIPVSDVDVAHAFYTNKLGFETITYTAETRAAPWVVVRPPGAETSIALIPSSTSTNPAPVLLFATDDLEATYRELRGQGVRFVQRPRYNARGTAILEDPDGNRLVLTSTD